MERSGKSQQFQLLKDFIGGVGMASYSDVASELGISESAARMATSRMRSRYRELLRDEISQTVIAEEDIDCEVQYLFKTFAE